jgi:glutamate synthase (NADPH/NADH) large chain
MEQRSSTAPASLSGGSHFSLLDARFDHESCGVGFIAALRNTPTHDVLAMALTALSRLAHRGAVAADGLSSDGIGITTGIPRDFLLTETGLTLATGRPLGVGMLFLPADSAQAERELVGALTEQQLEVLGWRDVPTRPEVLGRIALSSMPVIRQVLISPKYASTPLDELDRRAYLARKQFERSHAKGYVCSLGFSTLIYKSMCAGRLLPEFFPDLADERYTTAFAVFHQRFATNVAPSWDRAQPFRMIGHNGEINTIWGNRARMDARAATLPDELKPIYTADGSDSTSLDETIELLTRNGRTVAESVRMVLPPAVTPKDSAFLQYNGDCMEPWDGPAAVVFTDGRLVGAALDRNGLRPCRFFLTDDDLVIVGSEAGLVDLDPEHVVHSGRLGPGQMLLADLVRHALYEDEQVQALFDGVAPLYEELLEDATLEDDVPVTHLEASEVSRLQLGFGYTREDVNMVLKPMVVDAKDAVWSMGDDTPLAPLARAPRPVYAFFRQRFAQVTNPPIDSLRESCVIRLHTRLGPWPHILDKTEPLPGLSLASPILSLGQMEALRQRRHALADEMPLAVLDCVFHPECNLVTALDDLCAKAHELVRGGAAILLLSDRSCGVNAMPLPMAMALGAVHHSLIRSGLRTNVGLAVEAGDCRDLHHVAVLLGMGAGAVCPWLALESARQLQPESGEANLLHAMDAGLAKVMSKMGISVVDSYRSAHLFDCLGLSHDVVEKCFAGTPAPIGGVGFQQIESNLRELWLGGYHNGEQPGEAKKTDLPDYGWVRFRKAERAEPHSWQPQTVRLLQSVVGTAKSSTVAVLEPEARAQAWAAFRTQTVEQTPTVLRELLQIRAAASPLPLEQIEPVPQITHRFIASAMSLGSLSPEAHQTITAAMNMLGARSNTGEGGEDPEVYQPHAELPLLNEKVPATLLNNRIKQVASARFGVTAEYLAHAEEIEIKIAQGAKPGEGGQLPGHKVTELIARLRHAQPGVQLISPPPHHDIYSIEDLAQLIFDLRRVSPKAAIGVKLVAECGVGTVAAGVAKAYADYIVIAGHAGGTGASPLTSIKYAGDPWELGLAETQQVLLATGLRGRVRLRADGGLRTARDVVIAAMLGADEFAFGTAVLVALGCDMARQCHLNTCPTGIATQRPELRAKFRGRPEHLVRLFEELARDIQQLLAELGLPSLDAAIGRTDLLEQVHFDGCLDLRAMLAAKPEGEIRWQGKGNARPEEHPALDDAWLEPGLAAYRAGESLRMDTRVSNEDRTLGARLAGQIAALRTAGVESEGLLDFRLKGIAGQSFGAFAVAPMQLTLEGMANDFVGKGLSGGEIILRGQGRAALHSELHTILGNVALYGATSGALFAAGCAGERFAVRNSGALAVVEGVGDHGCEYMTGGLVVVLGATGTNFGAGMTGGLAWVYDEEGALIQKQRYHESFLQPEPFAALDDEAKLSIHNLVSLHAEKTGSTRAYRLLASWDELAPRFVRMTPKPQ